MKKNEKISLSLKKFHKTKKLKRQQKKDILIIIGIALYLIYFINGTLYVFSPTAEAKAPESTYFQSLPVNRDRILTVPEQIRQIAREKNFKWEDYLIRLAKCENDTFDPERHNEIPNVPVTSKDHGIFMINDYWHSEVDHDCSHDVECATKWTIDRINNGYQHEWSCDKLI